MSPTSSSTAATRALSMRLLLAQGGAAVVIWLRWLRGWRAVDLIGEVVGRRGPRNQLERMAPLQPPWQLLLAVEVAEHPGDELLLDEDGIPRVGVGHIVGRRQDAPVAVGAARVTGANGMLEPSQHERL